MSVFFADFSDVGSILGRSGAPKIEKKTNKSCSGRLWNAFKIFDRFWNGIGKVWGRFWEGLGWVSEGFLNFLGRNFGEAFQVEELALMIRATRGRSTERQRDRETERADLIL